MPARQLDGRIAQAELIAAQPIMLAWGTGADEWDDAPEPEPTDNIALVAEVGRRLATQVGYVLADPAGAIETPQGNYTLSATPTRNLYVRVTFGFEEAADLRIRELALFIGTVVMEGLPDGQRYFTPDQISDPGRCLLLDRSQNFLRNGSVRPAFEYVIPF
ncbi:hypothetical protein [Thauera butanivorans]|uniref:hypothetical protein n=1 Tax=Thauera butanivorans TaxID=86174 RepID=UPI000838EAB2|nr:hypothetical protein [Thauera butanivorans]